MSVTNKNYFSGLNFMNHDYYTAPNGMNFSRSIKNPNSRLNRVRQYLKDNGPVTKQEILFNVFGKVVVDFPVPYINRPLNTVTRGWGTWLFGYGKRHGYFKTERKGNKVYWSLG